MANLKIKKFLNGTFAHVLDGDEDNAVIDNNPNATSIGDVFNFKTKNGANIIQKQFIRYDDISYVDDTDILFSFANTAAVWTKLIAEGYFFGVNGSGGGSGAVRFDELLDTFEYVGNDGKVPVVNQSSLSLVPTVFYNFNQFTQLSDVAIDSLIAGKLVSVALVLGVPKIVLSDPQEIPDQLANAVGFFNIADVTTQTTPISYTTGAGVVLTNDNAGAGSTSVYRPYGVTTIWNATTNRFDFNQLSLGDEILLRIDLKVTTAAANTTVVVDLVIGEGTADQLTFRVLDKYYKNIITDEPITNNIKFFIGSELRRTAPGKLLFLCKDNDDATVKVSSFQPTITRKGVNVISITGDAEASHFKGDYNITTNTPTLANGTGDVGDEYKLTTAGSRDFGAGILTFGIADIIAYNGSIWYKKVDNNQSGSFVSTRKAITASNLSTQTVAGFLTYVNGVTSFAIAKNELVIYEVTDTGQKFLIYKNNTTVGSGQTALVSTDVSEIDPTSRGIVYYKNYRNTASNITTNAVTTLLFSIEIPAAIVKTGYSFQVRTISAKASGTVTANPKWWLSTVQGAMTQQLGVETLSTTSNSHFTSKRTYHADSNTSVFATEFGAIVTDEQLSLSGGTAAVALTGSNTFASTMYLDFSIINNGAGNSSNIYYAELIVYKNY